VSALGTQAGIWGNEQGNLEAWVYPFKILKDFHLRFHVDGAIVPAETQARTLIVRPESTTIVYAGDNFSVRETLFVPVHEPGMIFSWNGPPTSATRARSGILVCALSTSRTMGESLTH
jgi:hypothetical protein